jgi:glycosyltransferase involved in cell wall biosynthesis
MAIARRVRHLRVLGLEALVRLRRMGVRIQLFGLAAVEGVRTRWRRLRRRRPRLIWGPSAILNVKYWSLAMRELGYESETVIDADTSIAAPGDFDRHVEEFGPPNDIGQPSRLELFKWVLRRGDVFLRYYDLGFLRATEFQWLESALMRVAGKKMVVSPFGSDIAVKGYLDITEESVYADYPELPAQSEAIRERVVHTSKWADLVIQNTQHGFQPRCDVYWPTQVGIDERLWEVSADASGDADGHDGEVVVIHAPNHRAIKGTEHLLEAIRDLQEEGLRIRLELLEKRSNEEVRETMRSSDIVVEQLIAGYALFGIEGMAAGKPVLSNMSWMPAEMRNDAIEECPIVDTNAETLRENLRAIAEDPARRRDLGRAGRQFVLRYHSLEAMGRDWQAIIDHVWLGTPLPVRLLPPQGIAR